jgi:hypothetical protein
MARRKSIQQNSARNVKARAAETAAQLREIEVREKQVKKQLVMLECSIVAAPALAQETRLKNWNTLPPADDIRYVGPRRPVATRAQEKLIRQARAKQALFALFLLVILAGFAAWFLSQIRSHHIWE